MRGSFLVSVLKRKTSRVRCLLRAPFKRLVKGCDTFCIRLRDAVAPEAVDRGTCQQTGR